MLPLGGYVKMLGQDDSDVSATSDEPDSFTRAPVYKRMVIISAGVIMNLITAAVLFVIVFTAGLKTESATIGGVVPGSAAANAKCVLDDKTLTGLQPGDTIVWVDGERIEAFKDVSLAVAMSRKGSPIDVTVKRGDGGAGSERGLVFSVLPAVDPGSGMLAIGVEPARTGKLPDTTDKKLRETAAAKFTAMGAPGVEPGMELVDAQGKSLGAQWLEKASAASGGAPVETRWRKPDGTIITSAIRPRLVLEQTTVERAGADIEVYHLAGLTPVMSVRAVADDQPAAKAGVKAGDVFARLGDAQWPSIDEGQRQIRTPGRQSIAVTVLRDGKLLDLGEVQVVDKRIGIELETTESLSVLTRFPAGKIKGQTHSGPMAGTVAEIPPGSRVVRIGDRATPTFRELRGAMQELIAAGQKDISLTLQLPAPSGAEVRTTQQVVRLSDEEAKEIAALAWESPLVTGFFEPVEVELKRSNPISAVGKGLDETRKMVLTTYLTFARLFQGSVKVEHLKGPIGIADVGTRLAGKGWVWLLFFMAAVSVNLAVVNFLPLPIVDGGHFCFLLWEQFTGKPVSVAVQNVAAIIGLALIGTVFLLTTYNDLANLLWR
ncbi:MAG: site-2 protease family protein [Phycisphaerales bacterium]